MPNAYPLKLKPIYKEKVWGGRKLEKLGRTLPGDASALIGESWELVDLGQTSVSGGGGGAERSVITNGHLKGKTLAEACKMLGPDLLGRLKLNAFGEFPLLVKFLDSRENLSVQVHPSESYAAAHPDAFLKSEAWYIVEAEPGAVIYKGIKPDVTPAQFRAAIETNTREAVEPLMIAIPMKAGDCHYLPSGTCHALGAGLLVAEVQTPSDTTFRVFDWGRQGRELHIEQAMQSIHFGPPSPEIAQAERRTHIAGIFTAVSCLVSCEHFRIEKVRMAEGYEQEIPYDQPTIWIVLSGKGRIKLEGMDPVSFSQGETLLLPAKMNGAKVALDANTVWLEVSFPKTRSQLIA